MCCAVLCSVVLCPFGTQILAPGISWISEKLGFVDLRLEAILGCILGFPILWALQSPHHIVQLLYSTEWLLGYWAKGGYNTAQCRRAQPHTT